MVLVVALTPVGLTLTKVFEPSNPYRDSLGLSKNRSRRVSGSDLFLDLTRIASFVNQTLEAA
jgi:hypothetical protein